MTFDPHEKLVNMVVKLTSPISELGSIVAKNGFLKEQLGYTYEIDEFKNEFSKIYKTSFHPPDGFLRNRDKQITLTLECKSDLDDQNSKLEQQIRFYSENEIFKETFLDKNEKNEILIVCFEDCYEKIKAVVEDLDTNKNIVIWIAYGTENEKYLLTCKYGDHIDKELDKIMKNGVEVDPLSNILFLSPNVHISYLTAEIIKRLLSVMHSYIEENLIISEFIENQPERIIPPKRIKQAIKFSLTLAPEIGVLEKENSEIRFKKRIDFPDVLERMKFIETLSKEQLHYFVKKGKLTKENMDEFSKTTKIHKKLTDFM